MYSCSILAAIYYLKQSPSFGHNSIMSDFCSTSLHERSVTSHLIRDGFVWLSRKYSSLITQSQSKSATNKNTLRKTRNKKWKMYAIGIGNKWIQNDTFIWFFKQLYTCTFFIWPKLKFVYSYYRGPKIMNQNNFFFLILNVYLNKSSIFDLYFISL